MVGGERDQSSSSGGYRFLGLGMELAAAVAGLTLVGVWVDRHFETSPWGVLVGAVVGVVGGLYNVVKAVIRQAGAGTSETTKKSSVDGE